MNDNILNHLSETIAKRAQADICHSYVAQLLHKGQDSILKKVGEETTELIMASKDQNIEKIIYECADVWFHTAILLQYHGLNSQDILKELARREGVSGLVEKSLRNNGI